MKMTFAVKAFQIMLSKKKEKIIIFMFFFFLDLFA